MLDQVLDTTCLLGSSLSLLSQLKNGANNSAYFQELLCALHSVSGAEPSYRIAYRLYMSSVYHGAWDRGGAQ